MFYKISSVQFFICSTRALPDYYSDLKLTSQFKEGISKAENATIYLFNFLIYTNINIMIDNKTRISKHKYFWNNWSKKIKIRIFLAEHHFKFYFLLKFDECVKFLVKHFLPLCYFVFPKQRTVGVRRLKNSISTLHKLTFFSFISKDLCRRTKFLKRIKRIFSTC